MNQQGKPVRALVGLVAVLAVIGVASAGVYRLQQTRPPAARLPVARARTGDFLVIIRSRGEGKAGRSVQLYAPIVPNLRIAWLAPPGQVVEAGQPVIKFDSSSAQQQLVQKEAGLAAKRSIVTVEEVVDRLDAPPNSVVLPSWVVDAVCPVKGGAFPSYAQGYYPRNNAFYKKWDFISRERETFQKWLERHIMGTRDFGGFKQSLEEATQHA